MGLIKSDDKTWTKKKGRQQGRIYGSQWDILAVEGMKESSFLPVFPPYSISSLTYSCHVRSVCVLQIPDKLSPVHYVVLQLFSPGRRCCSTKRHGPFPAHSSNVYRWPCGERKKFVFSWIHLPHFAATLKLRWWKRVVRN